jgi:fructose-1,6-bisphosphatase/inositol monophosphatase family enzyme
LPWYATSLCAVDGAGPLAAEVVNLATGDRFRAVRGEGVESDEIDIGPSACTELSDAIVGFSGLPPAHGGWRQFRVYGAVALDLCAVATGTFDGYVDVDRAHGVWDYLGATLVCWEAGVPVVDSRGENLVELDPGAVRAPVAAATEELLQELLAMEGTWHR